MRKSRKTRWKDPPHHELSDDETFVILDNDFGYILVFHEKCGGLMSSVKLYVDCFPEDMRFRDFSRPDAIGSSRVVLGMKCEECGYANCLNIILNDTRIFTLDGSKPKLKQEHGFGKYPPF